MPAIRDPVHNWIKCSKEEIGIIDSPLFQRLQWVSQLTSVKQIFPGGVHTRFLHSLGVMHLAGDYLIQLLESIPATYIISGELHQKYYQLARLAGMLHDIGHGPFSHAFDRTIYKEIYNVPDGGHDFHRLRMIKSDMLQPLIQKCGIDPEELIAVWNSKTDEYKNAEPTARNWYDIIRAVVQGPLGADRMDFTLRDSYFTGTTHLGTIAATRIISNTKLIQTAPNELRIHYHLKCLSDIIQALSGRYYMYDSVYLHKTTSAANILIEKMLHYSAKYLKLKEKTDDLEEFQWLNDSTIIGALIVYEGTDQDMLIAKENCQLFLQRKLPKLKVELMEPSKKKFNPEEYLEHYSKELSIPKGELEILRTRSIYGIEPDKFDAHQIYFWRPNPNQTLTCQEALDTIQYKRPQEPHYLVRIYHSPPSGTPVPDADQSVSGT